MTSVRLLQEPAQFQGRHAVPAMNGAPQRALVGEAGLMGDVPQSRFRAAQQLFHPLAADPVDDRFVGESRTRPAGGAVCARWPSADGPARRRRQRPADPARSRPPLASTSSSSCWSRPSASSRSSSSSVELRTTGSRPGMAVRAPQRVDDEAVAEARRSPPGSSRTAGRTPRWTGSRENRNSTPGAARNRGPRASRVSASTQANPSSIRKIATAGSRAGSGGSACTTKPSSSRVPPTTRAWHPRRVLVRFSPVVMACSRVSQASSAKPSSPQEVRCSAAPTRRPRCSSPVRSSARRMTAVPCR